MIGIQLLSQIPDALGTKYYLEVLKDVIDSYLDRKLAPLQRVEEIWFGVYFYRYWRHYIMKSSAYTLESNFISQNTYLCIEINANTIVTLLLTLCNKSESSKCFMP